MKLSSILLFVLFITSCGEPNTKQVVNDSNNPQTVRLTNQSEFRVYEWEHKGHTYIVIDRAHGSGITHAGHCPCGK